MQRLTELRPRGVITSEEAPSTRGPLHDFFPIRLDDEFMATASGGLGFALPAAVGAALAQPNRTVFCLLGDGSAMYSIQGLWTAADLKLDVKFLIVNNGGYAALDQFGALFDIEVVGSKLPGIDFVKLAEGMGVPGARVAHVDSLDDAIRALFASAGPRLLEVVVERPRRTSSAGRALRNSLTKRHEPMSKVFITCAITGASPMPKHPNFPFRPDHVAQEALDAAEAGASIIHVHVRNREDGTPSQSLDDYREVVNLIRQKNNEVILNVTTGPGCMWFPKSAEEPAQPDMEKTLMFTAERRIEHIIDLKPDMCTLDICTMNLWGGVAINLEPIIGAMGTALQDAGVLTEIECFEAGDFVFADDLMAKGLIPKNAPFTFVLGTHYGLPPRRKP